MYLLLISPQVKEKLTADPDSEIATTSLRVSLMCPVSKAVKHSKAFCFFYVTNFPISKYGNEWSSIKLWTFFVFSFRNWDNHCSYLTVVRTELTRACKLAHCLAYCKYSRLNIVIIITIISRGDWWHPISFPLQNTLLDGFNNIPVPSSENKEQNIKYVGYDDLLVRILLSMIAESILMLVLKQTYCILRNLCF